jgi:hypothetical protein
VPGLASNPNIVVERRQVSLNMDHYRNADELRRLIRETSGVTELMRGGNIPGASATEINAISAANLNLQTFSNAVEDFDTEAVEMLLRTDAHFWTDARWIVVPGEKPVFVTREMMQAPSSLEAIPGSTVYEDDAVMRKQLIEYRNLVAQTAPHINLRELDRIILARFPQLRHEIDKIIPLPDDGTGPEAENRLMFAGFPVPGNPQADMNHLRVHQEAMATLQQIPDPQRARMIAQIMQQHMAQEQATMQGGAPQGGLNMQGSGEAIQNMGPVAPRGAPGGPGPTPPAQMLGNAQNTGG